CAKQAAAAAADEIEPEREPAVGSQLVALAVLDDEVERGSAAFLCIAVLVEAGVVDSHRRAAEEASAPAFTGHPGDKGHQGAAPVALHVLLDRFPTSGAGKGAAAAEIDQADRAAPIGAEATPLPAPVSRKLVSVGEDARLIAAVVVFVPEPGRAGTEAAHLGIDLARRRETEAAQIVVGGLAFGLLAGPAGCAHENVEATDQIDRALRIGDLAREGPRAEANAFERPAGMVGQHLADRLTELVAVGDAEEHVLDLLVLAERREHGVVGSGLRAVETQLLRGALGDVDRDRVRRGVDRERRL